MNIIKQFYYSFTSPKRMAIFRFQGIGKTIGYIFFLMLLSTIPIGISLALTTYHWKNALETTIIPSAPDFTIREGKLYSNQQYTYEEDNLLFILDPSGRTTEKDLGKFENVIALLEENLVLKSSGSAQTLPYSSLYNAQISKDDVLHFLRNIFSLLIIIVPVLYGLIYLLFTFFKFVGVTALSCIGLLLRRFKWPQLTFKHIWVMSAYAVTIPTIFFSIINSLQLTIPAAFIVYWFSAILILYLAFNEIPPKKG